MTCDDKSRRVPTTLARRLRDTRTEQALEAEREATCHLIDKLERGLDTDEIIPKHVIHQRLLNPRYTTSKRTIP